MYLFNPNMSEDDSPVLFLFCLKVTLPSQLPASPQNYNITYIQLTYLQVCLIAA